MTFRRCAVVDEIVTPAAGRLSASVFDQAGLSSTHEHSTSEEVNTHD